MKVGSGMAAVYSNYIGKNDIDNFPASGYTFKERLRLRMWRNGRRTSLRSWRATVGVQVPSSALSGYQNKGVVGAATRSAVNILELSWLRLK